MNIQHIPAKRITLMEDRALVEHQGQVMLAAQGVEKICISGLPSVMTDKTLRIEVGNAEFLDASVDRKWIEQPAADSTENRSGLQLQRDELNREIALLNDKVSTLVVYQNLLDQTRADLIRAIEENTGCGTTDFGVWKTQLNELSLKSSSNDTAILDTKAKINQLTAKKSGVETAINKTEQPVRTIETLLNITINGSGLVDIIFSYIVPCAMWRPIYRATLENNTVTFDADAMVWQSTGQDWKDVSLQFSTARPSLGTNPPDITDDRISLRPKTTQEKKVVTVAFREEDISSNGEISDGGEMAGLDDGGEVRLLKAQANTDIPSDGKPYRIPLFSFVSEASTGLYCPSVLSRNVFTYAKFKNASDQVLLAGPVDLIRKYGLVGKSQVKFAAPGETIKMSFGIHDDIKVIRALDEKTDESKLTGKRTTTTTVKLYISNTGTVPVQLTIDERIPVSEGKDVTVDVLEKQCMPVPQPVSSEGIVTMVVDLEAHETKTAAFVWQMVATRDVAGV
jgi:uncharacterized protein (TIGR02231 family)